MKNHTGIVSALILGVAIVSSAILLNIDTGSSFTERAVASPSSALRSQIIEKDSDGDGLLDWEESLWGTDPFVIDTDGDGILDGEYIANRKKEKTPEEIIAFEDLSFTSQFSRTFFGEYLQYQSDGQLTDVEKNALIGRLANSVQADLPETFPLSQVKTVPATDESIATYFTSIAILVAEASPKGITKSELILLEEALNANDPNILADVEKISQGYATLAESLKDLEAPATLRAQHSALITSITRLSAISKAFANTFTDAVYSLAVLPESLTEANRLIDALAAIHIAVSSTSYTQDDNVVAARQALGL